MGALNLSAQKRSSPKSVSRLQWCESFGAGKGEVRPTENWEVGSSINAFKNSNLAWGVVPGHTELLSVQMGMLLLVST